MSVFGLHGSRAAAAGALLIAQSVPALSQTAPGCTAPPVTITHAQPLPYNPNPNVPYQLDAKTFPDARCNDGTPGNFAVRMGVNSTRWIFHLEEGGSCSDSTTCASRRSKDASRTVTSSIGVTQGYVNTTMWGAGATSAGNVPPARNTGVIAPNPKYNPDFWDANVVEIFYCSSDEFQGGYSPPPGSSFNPADPATWYFRGRAIAMATVQSVVASSAFNGATDVLWTGTSAGGIGAISTFNDVLPLFPAGVRVTGMSDGGLYRIDYPAFNPNGAAPNYFGALNPTKLQSLTRKQDMIWHGRGDVFCDALAGPQNHVNCYDTSFMLAGGYFTQPFIVVQGEEDDQVLKHEGIVQCQMEANCTPGSQPAQQQPQASSYIAQFDANALTPFATSLAPPVSTLFRSRPGHVQTDNANWTSHIRLAGAPTGTTPAALVGQWYRTPCPAVQMVEEGTPGFR